MVEPTSKQRFLTLLAQAARITGEELRKETIQVYDESLSGFGYERVNDILETILMGLSPRSLFPTPASILRALCPTTDPESEALEASGRILQAITRFGPYQHSEFRDFVGELGWAVVESSGGVRQVCEIESKDIAAHRAQWTRLAQAKIIRGEAGLEGVAPRLPEPKAALKALAMSMPEMPKEKL